jgi:hypothetical protein
MGDRPGLMMMRMPANPSAMAARRSPVTRSPRKMPARIAVQIGNVNSIEITSASGMREIARNQQYWAE